MKTLLTRMSLAAVLIVSLGAAGASSASAASCSASPVSIWKAYNVNCSYVQHWDRLENGTVKYAPRVTPQRWSDQGACHAYVKSYGALKGVKVNWV